MPKVLLNPYRNALTIDGLVLIHDAWLDQGVRTDSDVVFNSLQVGDLTANGNIFLTGTVTQVNTDNLLVKDAFIELNTDNTDPLLVGGLRIHRGNLLPSFDIVYNESNQTLRIGNPLNLRPVAVREESPTNDYLVVWESATSSFVTTNTLNIDLVFSNIQVTDTITVGSSLANSPKITSNVSNDLLFNTTSDIVLGDPSATGKSVIIPENRNIVLESSGTNVIITELGSELSVSSNILLNDTFNLNWGASGKIFANAIGETVNIQGNIIFIDPTTETLFNSTRINHDNIGFLQVLAGNVYKLSSIASLKLESGGVGRVFVNNLSIGAEGAFQVDIDADITGNLSIDTPGDLILSPNSDVFINTSKRLSFGTTATNITTTLGDLVLTSNASILLNATSQVYIPSQLNIKTNTSLSEQLDGTAVLTASTSDILLSPGVGKGVKIPVNKPLIFGTSDSVYSTGSEFKIDSQDKISLNSLLSVNIPQGIPLEFGGVNHYIYKDISNDLHVSSSNDIVITALENIVLSQKVNIGTTLIKEDIDGSLTLSSETGASFVKVIDDLSITTTTVATSAGLGSLKTQGGVYINKNLYVKTDQEIHGKLSVGTAVSTAIVLQDTGIPIQVQNSSLTSGVVLELKGSWDTNVGYTIGRGTNTLGGGRAVSFTVAPYSIYGIGSKPSFIFGTSNGVEFMNIKDTGVTIALDLNVTNNGTFGGILEGVVLRNTIGNFEVTNTGVTATAGVSVENGLLVSDASSNPVFNVSNLDITLYKDTFALSNVQVSGTLTSNGKIFGITGADFSGDVNCGGNRLYNVSTPILDNDVVNKAYVDAVSEGRTNKLAVLAASTGTNVVLTNALFTLDSETVALDDRILLKDQTDPIQNGLYILDASNLLSRTDDMLVGSDASGSTVFVMGGTVNVSVGFVVVGNGVVVGTDAVQWTPFSGAATINVTTAMDKTGNTLSVKVDNFAITTNGSNELSILSSYIGQGLTDGISTSLKTSMNQSHVTQVGILTTGVWNGTIISVPFGGTGLSSVPSGNILYGNGTSGLSNTSSLYFTGDSLGINTAGLPQEYLHVKNVSSTFTGSFILLEDTDTLISQSSGLKIKNVSKNASVTLDSDGVLVIGQDDINASSRVSLSTQQITRMTVDADGNVLVGTNSPSAGYLLTVNGGIIGNNIHSTNSISIPQATLSEDTVYANGLLITSSSLRLTGTNLIAESDAKIGNIRLISSTPNESTILSAHKVTNAPISLYIRVANTTAGLAAVAFNGGFLVPNTFQIGGITTDPSSGFQLKLLSDELEVNPGITGKRVIFKGPTRHNDGISLIDSLSPNDIFNYSVSFGTLKLTSVSTGTTSYTIGGASSSPMIFTLESQSGDNVKYDPTPITDFSGGVFQVSSNISSQFANEIVLSTVKRYTASNAMEGVFSNLGWYYLGELGTGKTCIVSPLSWDIRIEYDGVLPYSISHLVIMSRSLSNLVIYKTPLGVYQVFIKVLRPPNKINVEESPVEFKFDKYEGGSTSPTGTESGYIGTWTLDFDLSIATATGQVEVGSFLVQSGASLTNTTLLGTTTVTGGLDVNGNSLMVGNQYRWDSTVTSDILMILDSTTLENSMTVYSKDTASPIVAFDKVSANASISMNSVSSPSNANALVINHSTNNALSKIVFKTRDTDRLLISDTGNVTVYSTVDSIETDIGSLMVSGGAIFKKRVKIKDQLSLPELKLYNGPQQVTASVTATGELTLNGNVLTGLSDPVNDTDAVNKRYVESVIQGLDTKESVLATSDGSNVDISVAISALDNVLVNAGNRILLKDQTDPLENGIYVVLFAAAPVRSDDLPAGSSANGVYVYTEQGLVNGSSGWVCTTIVGQDIVDTNGLTFVQFSGAGQITAGLGLSKIGNILFVDADDSTIEVNSGQVRIKNTAAGTGLSGGSGLPLSVSDISHLNTVGTLTSGVWNGSVIGMAYGGTGLSSVSNGRIVYSNGVSLSEGLLYFDDINVRVGINTTSPTSGLTVKDRDVQIHQSLGNALYMLMSSATDNYSYGIRNDSTSLVISSGTGVNKATLTDIASFDSSGVLDVVSGITSNYITLNQVKYSNNLVSKSSAGALKIDYYSADNTGSYLRFYGGLGTESSTVNSEYLDIGFNGLNNVIASKATGTGVAKSIKLSVGNFDNILLSTTGGTVMSGALTVGSTTESTSKVTGSIVTGGGIGAGGTIYGNKLHITDTTNTAAFIDGYLTVSRSLIVSGTSQDYSLKSNNTGDLVLESLSSGTGCYLQIHTKDSANISDAKIQIFSKGVSELLNSEWMDIGYNSATDCFELRNNSVGTGVDKCIVLSSISGQNQIEVNPSGDVVVNSDLTVDKITVTDPTDAISHINGGAMTVSGGLGITKSAYIGNFIESPIYKVTNRTEHSNASSIDKVYTRYTTGGNFHYYNNSSLGLNVHVGASGGPVSGNQELLYIGYKNSTTLSISSTSVGTGVTRDLSLETKLFPNQILLKALDGSVNFLKKVYLLDTSLDSLNLAGGAVINRTLDVVGKVSVGSGIQGDLLELKGIQTSWKFHSSVGTPGIMYFDSIGTNSVLNIRDSLETSIIHIDTSTKNVSIDSSITTRYTSTTAFVIQNASTVDKFVFDTINHTMDISSGRIINLATPLSPGDAVNKSYVDNLVSGLNTKESVVAGSFTNLNILNPITVVDGVTVNVGDRILLMSQTNYVENGIYTVQSGNFVTRTTDLSNGSRAAGVFTFVQQGVENGDKGFVCITDYPNDIVGTDNINFSQFNGSGTIDLGKGLIYNGTLVDVYIDSFSGLSFNGNKLRVNPTIAGNGLTLNGSGVLSVDPITELSTVTIGVWEASTIEVLYGGTGNTAFADKSIVYSNGTTLNGSDGMEWDYTKKALGINGIADPNTNSDGLTIVDKDMYMQSDSNVVSFLMGDIAGNYNWRIRRVIGDSLKSVLPISTHNEIKVSKNGNLGIVTGDPGDPFYMSTNNGASWFTVATLEEFSWGEVSISEDGTYIVLCAQQDYLYVSQNSGTTFTQKITDFTRFWEWTDISDNGQYMMASSLADGVHVSSDYGSTWTEIPNIPTDLTSIGFVHVSKTGASQFAGYFGGELYVSTNSGTTFAAHTIRSGEYFDIEEATNSNYMVLYEYPGSLWISSDLGVNWTERLAVPARKWVSVSMSEDGSTICATAEDDLLFVSTDFGVTFNSRIDATPRDWRFTKVSSDGLVMFAGGLDIPVFISEDSGTTWTPLAGGNRTVYSGSFSPVTNTIFFAEYNGKIYSYVSVPPTNLIFSSGKDTNKGNLSDSVVLTDNGLLGVGFNESTASGISGALHVNGTAVVSQTITLGTPLEVSSGGIGTNSLGYGIVLSNDNLPFTSTGGLSNGEVLIGKSDNSGTLVKESGSVLRSHLGLGIGVDIQSHSAILDSLGILSPANGYFIVGNGTSFVTQSTVTVRTTLGLGALSLLDNVNNSYWLGTQLSVGNGGTGSTSFTTSVVPYYNGTILTNSLLFNDLANYGIGINKSSVLAGNKLTVYGGDLALQGALDSNPVGLLFLNADDNYSWRIRREEDGITTGNTNLIFSGGVKNTDKTLLLDQLVIKSTGQVVVNNVLESTSNSTGSLVLLGGLGIAKNAFISGTLTIDSAIDSTSSSTGSVTLAGGLGVAQSVYIAGITRIQNTTDSTSSLTGSLIVSGGLGLEKKLWVSDDIIIEKGSSIGSNANGLTVGADTGIWVQDTVLSDASRQVSLVNNSANGGVVLSMRNLTSDYGWDQVVEGNNNNRLAFQTNGLATKTWMTIDAVTGTITAASTSDSTATTASSLVVSGGIYVSKSIHALAKITASSELSVSSLPSASPSLLTLNTDTGSGGVLKLNDSTTAADGGVNNMTLRNNNGDLLLQGSGSSGITVEATTGNCVIDSTQDATSSTNGGALTIPGGLAVAKKVYIGDSLDVTGSFSAPTLTSTPAITTVAPDMVNVSVLLVNTRNLMTINQVNTLQLTFKVTPSASATGTQFTFSLPNKTTNLSDTLDIYTATASGYEDNINLNQVATLCTGVSGALKGQVKFTSLSTGIHYIQVYISYSTS
jgi:hypothetical protein